MKVNIRNWKNIWFFFQAYKRQGLILLSLMFFSGFLEMLNLAALYPIINYGLSLEKKNFILEYFEKITGYISHGNLFFVACVVLVIISVFAIMFKLIYSYFSNKLLIRIMGDTQKRIFNKFTSSDYGFYVKNQQGELIYSGTIAPERATATVLYSINLLYCLVNAIFLFLLLILLSWQATGVIILVGILYAFVIKVVMDKFIHKCSQIYVEENKSKNVILNELITGIKSIKAFLAFNAWRKRYIQSVDRGLINRFYLMMGRIFPEMFVKFLFYILIALTGIFFSHKSSNDLVSFLPMLGTFAVVVNRFLPSIHAIGSSIMKIAEHIPDTKIVYELCTEQNSVIGDGQKNLEAFTNKIMFDRVWFKYSHMDDYLLKDLSFFLERKKMTALVGCSGSGKTTIINLLLKLYQIDKGAITIDDQSITDFSNESYLSKIGYVSQETFIFNSSIRENIRFGMEQCKDEMIEEAAALANADEFIRETQDGYDTVVGDAGVKLSGGQRQRIAIARAILRKPEIIIFDEATSSLDNISEKKIQKAIDNISKYTTVLVVAHRLSTVQNADKIIILEKGEVKEQGTHEELLKNKSFYYDLHRSKDMADREINKLVKG